MFQSPSLQSTDLIKGKLGGGQPLCLCERLKTAKSLYFNFMKNVAHFEDFQDPCSHCVRICSAEGSSIFVLLGRLGKKCSAGGAMILRPVLQLRDLSKCSKKSFLGVDNVTEGIFSQIAFCDISLLLELPLPQLVVLINVTRVGKEYWSVLETSIFELENFGRDKRKVRFVIEGDNCRPSQVSSTEMQLQPIMWQGKNLLEQLASIAT